MKHLLKLVFITLLSAGLLGCDVTVEDLVEDKEKRRDILKACTEMGIKAKDDKQCQTALEAEAEAAKRAAKGLLDSVK